MHHRLVSGADEGVVVQDESCPLETLNCLGRRRRPYQDHSLPQPCPLDPLESETDTLPGLGMLDSDPLPLYTLDLGHRECAQAVGPNLDVVADRDLPAQDHARHDRARIRDREDVRDAELERAVLGVPRRARAVDRIEERAQEWQALARHVRDEKDGAHLGRDESGRELEGLARVLDEHGELAAPGRAEHLAELLERLVENILGGRVNLSDDADNRDREGERDREVFWGIQQVSARRGRPRPVPIPTHPLTSRSALHSLQQ